jgi:SEC-C motif
LLEKAQRSLSYRFRPTHGPFAGSVPWHARPNVSFHTATRAFTPEATFDTAIDDGIAYDRPLFETTSKRRKGFPSETCVKRGRRIVNADKELVEKLGRNDPCPCGSARRFKTVLSAQQTL